MQVMKQQDALTLAAKANASNEATGCTNTGHHKPMQAMKQQDALTLATKANASNEATGCTNTGHQSQCK